MSSAVTVFRGGCMRERTSSWKNSCATVTVAIPALFALTSADVWAQERNAESDTRGQPILEEVIVTAEKREVNLQDTPISVTALTADALAASGAHSIADLTKIVPGLAVGGTGGRTRFAMRGVAAINQDTNVDDSVAFHVDGVYSSKPAAADVVFFDINRVEVLRGPQGTLFGRNATTGVINVISNRPSDKLEGEAAVEVGNYNTRRTDGMINVPLGNTVKARFAFTTYEHDGYLSDGRNDADATAGRVHLLWEPTERFSLLLSSEYSQLGGNGPGFSPFSDLSFDVPTSATDFSPYKLDNRVWSVHAEATWDFGATKLTYIPAYRDLDFFNSTLAQTSPARYIQENEENSQELRLSSNNDSPLQWTGGLFWHKDDSSWNTFFNFYGEGSPRRLAQFIPDQNSESYAAFGQMTYAITPSVRVTGGLRWSKDEKELNGRNFVGNPISYGVPPAFPPEALAAVYNGKKSWNSVTWKAGIDVDLAESSMVYLSAATGFHVGGFYNTLPPNSFEPETNTSIELGSKNRFLNDRLQINGAIYYQKYEDYQVLEIQQRPTLAGTTAPASVIFNVQEPIDVYGGELETVALLSDSDRLSLGVAYTHAYFPAFVLNLNTGPTNLDGYQMPKAPEFTGTLQYEHTWRLQNDFSVVAHFGVHAETSQWLTFQHIPLTQQSSYTKSDVALTLYGPDDRFDITLYGRNLEDDAIAKFAVSDASAVPGRGGRFWADLDPPRTYGIQVNVRLQR